MDRRDFLISTGGAVVAVTSASAAGAEALIERGTEGQAQAGRVLRLAMAWPDQPHGPADAARRLARRIALMTAGRLRIEVVAASSGPDTDAELCLASAHDFAHLHPAYAYFAGLPGSCGLSGAELAQWMSVGGGQMLWDDLAASHGWKPLLVSHLGEAPPLWARPGISAGNGFAGLSIAVPGLGADVVRALGGEPVRLDPAAVVSALADASIDAAEIGGPVASLAAGVATAAPYGTGQGLNAHGTALSLHIRLPVWTSLSEADQAIVSAAAADEFQTSLAEAAVHGSLAREVLEASFGVRHAPWPAEMAEAIGRVAEATVAHVAGHDAVAERIDHSYFAFRSMISGAPQHTRRGLAVG